MIVILSTVGGRPNQVNAYGFGTFLKFLVN